MSFRLKCLLVVLPIEVLACEAKQRDIERSSAPDASAGDGGGATRPDAAATGPGTSSSSGEPKDAATDAAASNSSDASVAAPPDAAAGCGDGSREDGEECEDGNTDDADGCSAQCRTEPGWDCPTGVGSCEPVCGDGRRVGAEAVAGGCDDDNTKAGDGCSAMCAVEEGYACAGKTSTCAPTCGNNRVDTLEDCDDGNTETGDGCFACALEPGATCDTGPNTAPRCQSDGTLASLNLCGEPVDEVETCAGDCINDTCRCVVRVNGSGGRDNNDGSSWAKALLTIQAALDLAEPEGCEVWVRGGTYVPGNARTDSFAVPAGVSLHGGFAGTESQRTERDRDANPTILLGQVDANTSSDVTDDAYHVVTMKAGAVLEGFTVSYGNSQGDAMYPCGSGVLNLGNDALVRNVAFSGTSVCSLDGRLTVENSKFTGMNDSYAIQVTGGRLTVADSQFEGAYGGISVSDGSANVSASTFTALGFEAIGGSSSQLFIEGCLFTDSGDRTVRSLDGDLIVANSSFVTNMRGVEAYGGNAYVVNSRFNGNTPSLGGNSGVVTSDGAALTLVGNQFAANALPVVYASQGGATLVNNTYADNDGEYAVIWLTYGALATISNSIFFDNRGGAVSDISVENSAVADLGENLFTDVGACSMGLDCPVGEPELYKDGTDYVPRSTKAIDQGDDAALPADTADLDGDGDVDEPVPFDARGKPRVAGRAVDLGATEVEP